MTRAQWLRSNWLFLAVIAVGLFLRVVWLNDMEWKYDEKWMYNQAQEVAQTGHWHSVGMTSGAGLVNPGLSAAIFAAMAFVIHSPTGMAAVVQWLNVAAIICFLLFIIFNIEKEQRDVWLWGLALAAISPLAVLFSRKIWAQDLLPIFSFVIIWANANRNKGWGAFLWGLFGALVGQIHMSGFYYAAGLAIFTIIYDYRNKRSFKWGYWILGSAVGSIGLIPWLMFITSHPQPNSFSLHHLIEFNFYIDWFIDSHALDLFYSLHKDFLDFIKEPYIGGHATYGIAALHVVLGSMALYSLKRIWDYLKILFGYIKQKQLFKKLTTNLNSTNFYLLAILLGLGVMMNFSGILLYQHYLIVSFPFMYIFIAKMFQAQKRLFIGLVFAQLVLTLSFFTYIHTHNGAKNGDYGITYRAQMEAGGN